MNRNKKTELEYRKYRERTKNIPCVFCPPPKTQILKELKYFFILKNIFPYAIWDYRQVLDHRMVVPKKHITAMVEFSQAIKEEYMDIISKYENKGYSLYTRTSGNKSKSIGHFHTHLIKTNDNEFTSLKYQENPYISEPKF